MHYFWSFLFLAVSLNAAYNPFFHEPAKPKPAPAPIAAPLPLPPLLKPPSEAPVFNLPQILYFGYLETQKGKFGLVKVEGNTIVLKEGDPFYASNTKYFIRNITSNYITVDNAGRIQTIYFTTGGQ